MHWYYLAIEAHLIIFHCGTLPLDNKLAYLSCHLDFTSKSNFCPEIISLNKEYKFILLMVLDIIDKQSHTSSAISFSEPYTVKEMMKN